jgi:glycosyltransferase involved in cell wall biosynthesis
MRVCVTVDQRFDRTPDGTIWTHRPPARSFWDIYLRVFDHVRVAARVRQVDSVPASSVRADGDGVSFCCVPWFMGPWQFFRRARSVHAAIANVISDADAVLLRVPSHVGNCVWRELRRRNHPYGVEVLADPYDLFAPGSVRSRLRPFVRCWFTRQLRRQCIEADVASYVTASTLQRRYPPSPESYNVGCSDVDLPDDAFIIQPRPAPHHAHRLRLITVGAMDKLFKGQDVLIDAVGACVSRGLNIDLAFLGDGALRDELQRRAAGLGLADRAHFLGAVASADAVRVALDRSDIFVLPSRTEGLPRAMIEAMARAMPCIGSTAGGIPELLESEDLVPPANAEALAAKIWEMATNPGRLMHASARNLKKACQYHQSVLVARRLEFYRFLRRRTESWNRTANSRTELKALYGCDPGERSSA